MITFGDVIKCKDELGIIAERPNLQNIATVIWQNGLNRRVKKVVYVLLNEK